MTNEIWKDIKGYEGLYQVSNSGRVKSLNYRKIGREHILKPRITRGYCQATFYKDGVSRYVSVHRLVAMAFIPNPENKPEIDHINTIRNDNRVENLRWVNRTENINNQLTIKKLGTKVVCVTTGEIFNSTHEAGRFYNIGHSGIVRCCQGSRKTSGKLPDGTKLSWRYLDL